MVEREKIKRKLVMCKKEQIETQLESTNHATHARHASQLIDEMVLHKDHIFIPNSKISDQPITIDVSNVNRDQSENRPYREVKQHIGRGDRMIWERTY